MTEDYLNNNNSLGGYNPQNTYQKQLDSIRKQQSAEEQRLRDQTANLIRQYEAQKPVLKQQFTDNAQDAYVAKMNTLKEMPQVLAAQGYNGGLSESSNIKVDNQYGNAYNGHQRDYNKGLSEVDNQIANTNASLNDMLSQNSTHYSGLIANAQMSYNQMLMQAQKEAQAQKLQEQVRQQQFDYQKEQDKLANDFKQQQFTYQKQQAAAKSSGSGNGSTRLTVSQAESAFKNGNTSKNVIDTLTGAYGDDYVSGEVSKVRNVRVNDWLSTPQMKLTIGRASKDQTPQFLENAIMNAVMRGELSMEEAEIASKRLGLEVK